MPCPALSSAALAVAIGRSRSSSVTGAATSANPAATCAQAVRQPRCGIGKAAHGDERDREQHAQQHRADAHRHTDPAVERLADRGDTRHRKGALTERRVASAEQEQQQRAARSPCSSPTPRPARSSVKATVVPRRPARSEQAVRTGKDKSPRRAGWPEVDGGVGDPVEVKIAQHRLGDEAEALGPTGQCGEHDHRCHDRHWSSPARLAGRPSAEVAESATSADAARTSVRAGPQTAGVAHTGLHRGGPAGADARRRSSWARRRPAAIAAGGWRCSAPSCSRRNGRLSIFEPEPMSRCRGSG